MQQKSTVNPQMCRYDTTYKWKPCKVWYPKAVCGQPVWPRALNTGCEKHGMPMNSPYLHTLHTLHTLRHCL